MKDYTDTVGWISQKLNMKPKHWIIIIISALVIIALLYYYGISIGLEDMKANQTFFNKSLYEYNMLTSSS